MTDLQPMAMGTTHKDGQVQVIVYDTWGSGIVATVTYTPESAVEFATNLLKHARLAIENV